MAEKRYNMEYNIDLFLQSLIERKLKKTYNVDNVVVQVDIDEFGMVNFKAKTFNDEYSKSITYKGYVEETAGAIIITKINDVNLVKIIETSHGTRYESNFVTLEI